MRSGHLSIALCCLLALSVGAGNCEDTTSKQTADKGADKAADKAAGKAADKAADKAQDQPLVPTLPPPTAEWPDFPGPDASKPSLTPAPSTETNAQPQPEAVVQPKAESESQPIPELTPAQMEPHKRPVPPGYDAAAALYKQKKFPQAAKAFEAIIKGGAANVDTHLSLAYCYLLQRLYSKAVKEFEWVEKYGKNSMTLQKQAGRTAISLRTMISGVCPAPCLKANDPRWFVKDGRRWITIRYSSKRAWNISDYHVGEYVANENGDAVLKGKCPVCGGTGQVARLKDGDPPPRL